MNSGYYDPIQKKVIWKSSFKSGISIVSTYTNLETLQSASFYGEDD
jgi:hypothetical protein